MGAIICALTFECLGEVVSMVLSAGIVILIRYLAAPIAGICLIFITRTESNDYGVKRRMFMSIRRVEKTCVAEEAM